MASRRILHCLGVAAALACAAPAAAIELSASERAGKRIYLEGRSASGSRIVARVGVGEAAIPGTMVPCANCHGADGRGRREGGIRPPDITWRRLATPDWQRHAGGRAHPPYDEASFKRAVSLGVDAGGNRLDPAMPRFVMSARDIEDLAAYLKRIEDDRDPGLSEASLRLGTLQPAGGPLAELGATVTAVLRDAIATVNAGGGIHGRRIELVVADAGGDAAAGEAALRRLVDEEQVFAVLAPLVPALDGRLSGLADAARVPLLAPLARSAEEGGPFVFDPLPGLGEQLGALAEYAAAELALGDRPAAIVHPDDGRSGNMVRALVERLARHGWSRLHTYAYAPGRFGAAGVEAARAGQGVAAVFFIGRDEDFGALATQLALQASPPWLFAVATQVGAAALRLAPASAARVLLASPTLPQDWSPQGVDALRAMRARTGVGERYAAFQLGAYVAVMVMAEGLKGAGRDASRAKLVAALETLHGFRTGLAPEIGFGPGRRVGAAGAHIVAVDAARGRLRPTGRYVRLDAATP